MKFNNYSRKMAALLLTVGMFLTSALANVQMAAAAMYPHEWEYIGAGALLCGKCQAYYYPGDNLSGYLNGTWTPDPYYGGSCVNPNAPHEHRFNMQPHAEREGAISREELIRMTGDSYAYLSDTMWITRCTCGQAMWINVHYTARVPKTDYVITMNVWDDFLGGWTPYYNMHFDTEAEWESSWAWYQSSNDATTYYTRAKRESYEEEQRSFVGVVQEKWVQIDGQWYYTDALANTVYGWKQVGGVWYYMGSDGAMKTGWQKVNGSWYYLNSAMKTGWQKISGNWYYLGSNGAMRTGWQKIDSKWYYLGGDGAMKNGWQRINNTWYYLDSAMTTGWKQISGSWYYFGSDGAMKTGWQKVGGVWYYLNSSMVTGWKMIGGIWYYFKSSGAMASNETLNIGGMSYSFGASGAWIH